MRRALLTALCTIALGPVVVPAGTTRADTVHELNFTIGGQGPLGSVSFIGDSVGIGAGRFSPTLPDHLVARGWGPVRFHAVDGKRTGLPPGWPDHFNAVPMIDEWQAAGWDSDTWIINLGANDSGYCSADVACAKQAIMLVVDAIGPGHRIWWPKITRLYTHLHQANAWNAALDQVDAERDDFWTWDWPAEMRAHPDVYGSWDNTHLYPDGYRQRSAVMAQAFTDSVATARRVGGDVALPPPTGSPSAMLAVDPVRLLDTRVMAPGRLAAGGVATIDLPDEVPDTTTAVAVNLAAVDPARAGFLTAFACGTAPPPTSNVNFTNRTRGAGAVVAVSEDSTICVASSTATDVIVDLQAAFVPPATPGALALTPSSTPVRLLDTRQTGRAALLTVPVPAGSDVVAVNLTVTGADLPGYVSAYPCGGEPPVVSNVNVLHGDTNASAGFVRVGVDDTICVLSSTPADVIIDLTGTLRPGSGLRYVPVEPRRMLDTRTAVGGWAPVHGAGQTLDIGVAAGSVGAVSGTLTLVGPGGPSFLSVAPCGSTASTSSVNAAAGDVVANAVTVAAASGRICITARSAGHTVFDVTGWWLPG